ncbi:MAG: hypothetical protein E7297_02070 [Lachnospiraceae bacterium]|jgi:hypothetical protein|nr:hypothetical protein [Lachnospiraceae bacterium]
MRDVIIGLIKKYLIWFAVLFMLLMAIVGFSEHSIVSGIIFLLLAFLCSPFRGVLLKLIPEKWRKLPIIIGASVVLFFGSIFGMADTDSVTNETEATLVAETTESSLETETDELLAKVESTNEEASSEESVESTEVEETKETKEEGKKDSDSKKKENSDTNKDKTTSEVKKLESTVTDTSSVTDKSTPVVEQPTPAAVEQPAVETPQQVQPAQSVPANDNSAVQSGGGSNNFETGTATQPGIYYIGNKTNGKLHVSTCRSLPKNENQAIFNTKEEAMNAGYTDPCGICCP